MKLMENVILHKLIQYSAYIKLYRPLGHIHYKKYIASIVEVLPCPVKEIIYIYIYIVDKYLR